MRTLCGTLRNMDTIQSQYGCFGKLTLEEIAVCVNIDGNDPVGKENETSHSLVHE